jgi:hypothetical protein
MPINVFTFLPLTTPEQVTIGGAALTVVGANAFEPHIDTHPDGGLALLTGSTDDDTVAETSMVEWEFAEEQSEVNLHDRIRFTHGVSDNVGIWIFAFLHDGSGTEICRLVRLSTSEVLRWRNHAGNVNVDAASGSLPKDTTRDVDVRYLAGSGGTGVISIAIDGGTPVSNTHSTTNTIKRVSIGLNTQVSAPGVEGNKFAWHRDLVIVGGDGSSAVPTIGLTTEQVADGKARFRCYFHHQRFGVDRDDLTAQLQVDDSGFTNVGAPVPMNQFASIEDAICHLEADGLDPNTEYTFRIVISDDGTPIYTTNEVTVTTPSVAGSPTTLRYAVSGDFFQTFVNWPLSCGEFLASENLHGVLCHSDFWVLQNWTTTPITVAKVLTACRSNYAWNWPLTMLGKVGSTAFGPDDRESVTGGTFLQIRENLNATEQETYDAARVVIESWMQPGRINPTVGDGWHFDTAKCRFIQLDMRTFKNRSEGSRTMFGAAQIASVKALLATDKRHVVLLAPTNIALGHAGQGVSPNGLEGIHEFEEYVAEIDDLVAHHAANSSNSRLTIMSGEYHCLYQVRETRWNTLYGPHAPIIIGCSPYAGNRRQDIALTDFDESDSEILFSHGLEGSTHQPGSYFTIIEVDETEAHPKLKIEFYDFTDEGETAIETIELDANITFGSISAACIITDAEAEPPSGFLRAFRMIPEDEHGIESIVIAAESAGVGSISFNGNGGGTIAATQFSLDGDSEHASGIWTVRQLLEWIITEAPIDGILITPATEAGLDGDIGDIMAIDNAVQEQTLTDEPLDVFGNEACEGGISSGGARRVRFRPRGRHRV